MLFWGCGLMNHTQLYMRLFACSPPIVGATASPAYCGTSSSVVYLYGVFTKQSLCIVYNSNAIFYKVALLLPKRCTTLSKVNNDYAGLIIKCNFIDYKTNEKP
jgi:hypothetical protein